MTIGERIKQRRKELGLTMHELSERVGVAEATISRWESGDIENMRRDKIVSLAKALDVSPAYLMGWTDIKNTDKEKNYNDSEQKIINNYRKLNTLGQTKADEYITDLSENPKYTIE